MIEISWFMFFCRSIIIWTDWKVDICWVTLRIIVLIATLVAVYPGVGTRSATLVPGHLAIRKLVWMVHQKRWKKTELLGTRLLHTCSSQCWTYRLQDGHPMLSIRIGFTTCFSKNKNTRTTLINCYQGGKRETYRSAQLFETGRYHQSWLLFW